MKTSNGGFAVHCFTREVCINEMYIIFPFLADICRSPSLRQRRGWLRGVLPGRGPAVEAAGGGGRSPPAAPVAGSLRQRQLLPPRHIRLRL